MDLVELRARVAQEARAVIIPFETRAEGDAPVLTGHAAVFDRWSADLGGFRERIARGAFRKALAKAENVVLNWEHDNRHAMAFTSDGSLRLQEDTRGLSVAADLKDVTATRDLMALGATRNYRMSFAFRVAPDGDEWVMAGDTVERTVYEVSELLDVSVVYNPAYLETDVDIVRALTKSHAAGPPVASPPPAVDGDEKESTPTEGDVADSSQEPTEDGPSDPGGQQRQLDAAWWRDELRRRGIVGDSRAHHITDEKESL